MENVLPLCMVCICLIISAFTSGVYLGLFSLDPIKLKIQMVKNIDRDYCRTLLPLKEAKQHHFLLVTLLLCNALVAECLPLFLDEIFPSNPVIVILISVFGITIAGEIIPAAFFTGSMQVINTARLSWYIRFLTIVFWPFAYPISALLDYMFGLHHNHLPNSSDLQAMMMLSNYGAASSFATLPVLNNNENDIRNDTTNNQFSNRDIDAVESRIITGVLNLKQITVGSSMVPIDMVHMISGDKHLCKNTIREIVRLGHSRLPVYRGDTKNHCVGLLLTKYLLHQYVDTELVSESNKVGDIQLQQPLFVSPDTPLLDMLNIFLSSHTLLAIVTNKPELALAMESCYKNQNSSKTQKEDLLRMYQQVRLLGIVTFEDVMEKMIECKIYDEKDQRFAYTLPPGPGSISSHAYDHGIGPVSAMSSLASMTSWMDAGSSNHGMHGMGANHSGSGNNSSAYTHLDHSLILDETSTLLPFSSTQSVTRSISMDSDSDHTMRSRSSMSNMSRIPRELRGRMVNY